MGCAMSSGQYLFENPFESERWLEQNRYRLFWRAAELDLSRAELHGLIHGWKKLTRDDKFKIGTDSLLLSIEKCPDIKLAFGNKFSRGNLRTCPKFMSHAGIFQDTIDLMINELSFTKQEDLCVKLVTFGSHHAYLTRRRFAQNFWCAYGQALLECAKRNADASNAFLRGWKKLVQCIIASMQIGYAIGYAQTDLPARFAFRKAVIDNEMLFFPLSGESSRASGVSVRSRFLTQYPFDDSEQSTSNDSRNQTLARSSLKSEEELENLHGCEEGEASESDHSCMQISTSL